MINQTLYKRTTTGAVQQWSQDLDGPRYRTVVEAPEPEPR